MKYNQDIIWDTIMVSKILKKVRRTQILVQGRLTTLVDKQGRKIDDQDRIIDRIEELSTNMQINQID